MAKVLISVAGDKLKRIDALARANGKSRSAYLVESALTAGPARYPRPLDDPKVRRALKVMEESRRHWKPGPGAEALVREIRDRGRY